MCVASLRKGFSVLWVKFVGPEPGKHWIHLSPEQSEIWWRTSDQQNWKRTREQENTSITATAAARGVLSSQMTSAMSFCIDSRVHISFVSPEGAYLCWYSRSAYTFAQPLLQSAYLCTAITAECIFLAFPVTNYPHSKSAWLLWLELGTPVWQNYGRLHGSNHGVELYQLSLQWPQQMRHTYRC